MTAAESKWLSRRLREIKARNIGPAATVTLIFAECTKIGVEPGEFAASLT